MPVPFAASRGPSRLRSTLAAVSAATILGAIALPVGAAPLLFDFNGVALSGNAGNGLHATGGNTAIRNYMNGVFSGNGFATSTVSVSGALATATYNGENHVVGPTLGTSDGGVAHPAYNDTFIINNNFGVGAGASDSFTLTFTNFSVFQLSFDWEIFPDATCPKGSYCASHPGGANWPDIELLVDGNSTPIWQMFATVNASQDPQAIGTSGVINLAGAHTLTFRDWPAEIGIDNLRISGCVIPTQVPRTNGDAVAPNCTPALVPEPASLPLVALAFGVALWTVRRGCVGAGKAA